MPSRLNPFQRVALGERPAPFGADRSQVKRTRYADHNYHARMSLREFLSARLGESIALTVAPDAFTFEGLGSRARIPTQIQMSDAEPGKIAAIGEDIPDPAQGPVISLFEGPRATERGWAHERYCILFCRYYLALFNDGVRYLLKPLGVGPRVDVFGSRSLRWTLAGQETVILDRVLRAAGAGTVRFLEADGPSPGTV